MGGSVLLKRREASPDAAPISGMITANATGAATATEFSTAHLAVGDKVVLKVQRAIGSGASPPLLVYDEGRRFSVLLTLSDSSWEALNAAVAGFAPTSGAKAFFSAHLEAPETFNVALEPLALLPW